MTIRQNVRLTMLLYMCISTQSSVKKVQTGWDGAAIEHNVKTGGIFM